MGHWLFEVTARLENLVAGAFAGGLTEGSAEGQGHPLNHPAHAFDLDAVVTSWSELVYLAERVQIGQGRLGEPAAVGG